MQSKEEINPVSKSTDNQAERINRSLIGKAVIVKGNIAATDEDMTIDGKLVGGIVVKNSKLEIGDTAEVDADVYARVIFIKGKVKGKITATDQVWVSHTGYVEGDISAPSISMEDGAFFKGNISMEKQEVSWEESIQNIQDENQEKSSSFDFLFRRSRNAQVNHAANTGSKTAIEEVKPLVAIDSKTQQELQVPMGKSFIGKTVLLKGHIESDEDMVVCGEIVGNIYLKSHSLDVGVQAHINGNIYVKNFTAYGEIKGDICADFVSIKKPAHIIGVIHSPRVSMESGATFQGKVEMEQQNIEEAYVKSITPAPKEKGSFLSKPSIDANLDDDSKSGSQGGSSTKSKRVPWPE